MRQQTKLLMTRRQRGFGMMDALVSLAILAVGMLALARLQSRVVAQSTDAQLRLTAMRLADELMNTALVDRPNATCYTVPAKGTCGSPVAYDQTAAWEQRVKNMLPDGAASAVLTPGTTNPLTVTVQWTGKGISEQRTLKVTTDVTP